MKTVLAFICILVLSQAAQLSSLNSYPVSKSTNLGFSNSTGKGVDPSIIPNIVNLINGASGFYKSDVAANIKYIKASLDYIYGNVSINIHFVIYIQTEAYVTTSWSMEYVNDWWLTLQNVNIINPAWSYFIFKMYGPADLSVYSYLKLPDVGPGITQNTLSYITNAIITYEPNQVACSCNSDYVGKILTGIMMKQWRNWRTICDASGVTQGLALAVDGKWGTFRVKKCYYTLFALLDGK